MAATTVFSSRSERGRGRETAARGPTAQQSAERRRQIRRRSLRASLEGWGFVGPAMVIVLGLSVFPAVWAFLLSMQKWNGFSTAGNTDRPSASRSLWPRAAGSLLTTRDTSPALSSSSSLVR